MTRDEMRDKARMLTSPAGTMLANEGTEAQKAGWMSDAWAVLHALGQERDALAAEIAQMRATQANMWKRIKRADIETMPELKEDWLERTAEDEYNRWLRILTAAEHGWLCPKCGAPAHRGEFKKQLDALVEPLYMKARGSAPSRDPVSPQEQE